jgi:hypothetical protein
MKKLAVLLGMGALLVGGAAFAQPYVVWELPQMTEPPELDGVRGEAEWAGAITDECSPSQVERDADAYGWMDEATVRSNRSHNQVVGQLGEEEDASEAGTDADYTSNNWIAWDEDAIYYIHEVRDNYHDTTQDAGGNPVAWWERDSVGLYIDLTNSNVGGGGELYESMNVVNTLAEPQASSNITVTLIIIEAGARVDTQEPDVIEGVEYGYRAAGDEFGGEEDYVIEAMVEWDTFMQFNLPDAPSVGTVMGMSWVLPDPDIAPGWNGQMVCWGQADSPATYDDFVFSDTPAGPGAETAAERDSWGRIKATFK